MKNVVAYARTSSNKQGDTSINTQIRAIKEYAKNNNLNVVKIYIDNANSSTNKSQIELQKMIKDSELKTFDQVIVHRLDRFSRNHYDITLFKQRLTLNGVTVRSVLENPDSPESIIIESVLEGMAEYISACLAKEIMKGMYKNAQASKHNGGKPPLGFDYDNQDGKYTINNREADAVKMIFRMYLDDYSYSEIVKELNDNGFKTKAGNSFAKNSLSRILANEKYTGVYIFNKRTSKNSDCNRNDKEYKADKDIIRNNGGMPEIICKDDFVKAQLKMEKNRRHKSPSLQKSFS